MCPPLLLTTIKKNPGPRAAVAAMAAAVATAAAAVPVALFSVELDSKTTKILLKTAESRTN